MNVYRGLRTQIRRRFLRISAQTCRRKRFMIVTATLNPTSKMERIGRRRCKQYHHETTGSLDRSRAGLLILPEKERIHGAPYKAVTPTADDGCHIVLRTRTRTINRECLVLKRLCSLVDQVRRVMIGEEKRREDVRADEKSRG